MSNSISTRVSRSNTVYVDSTWGGPGKQGLRLVDLALGRSWWAAMLADLDTYGYCTDMGSIHQIGWNLNASTGCMYLPCVLAYAHNCTHSQSEDLTQAAPTSRTGGSFNLQLYVHTTLKYPCAVLPSFTPRTLLSFHPPAR